MPLFYRFILLFFVLLEHINGAYAQCSTTPCTTPVPSVDATQACILPSPSSLDCYYGGTTDDLPISLPPSWCVVINNNHWFAFIADSTAATFNITCYGCAAGNGVQAAVLSTADCIDFTFNSPCLMEIPTQTSQVLVASPLVPGSTYYLCMDGVGGALCEYAINASNPTVTGTASGICVPSKPTGTYSTAGVSSWSIQPPSAGIIIGNPVAQTITVSWTEPGNAEVCARFTGCPNAPEYCFPVLVGGDVSQVQEVEVCQGKSVECAGKVFTTPGTFPVKLKTYLNCDSLINCVVHVIPKVYTTEMHYFCQNQSVICAGVEFDNGGIFTVTLEGENGCDSIVTCKISMIPTLYTTETHYYCQNETTTCAGVEFGTSGTFPVTLTRVNGCDSVVQCKIVEIPTIVTPFKLVTLCGPASYTLCSDTYTTSGMYTEICTSSKGCDSIVNVNLAILEPKAVIAPPGILDCTVNTVITLDGSGSSLNTASGGQTFYNWIGPGIVGAKDSAQIKVNHAGTYCLIVTHRRAGVACSDTVCVQVTAVSAIPPLPVLVGDVTPCPDSFSIYMATAVGSPAPSSFTWTTPGGIAYTTLSMQAIQIEWTNNLSGGPICVVANNSCGASPPACIDVTVQTALQIPVLSGPSTVCAGGGTYIYTLDGEQAGTTYTWSVPAGATLTGSGDTVVVNFLNASSGAVCVEAQTACEKGAAVCKNVTVQPIPSAQLTGGGVVCAGDSIQLTFTLTGNGPFTVNWFNGSTLDTLNAISNGYTLSLAPKVNTLYHLIKVEDNTSPKACTNLAHDSVSVTVHPNFTQSKSVQLCEGQSIVAGGGIQTQSGVYVDSLQTLFGCDSILITNLTVYAIDTLIIQLTTCDPALAGIHTDMYLQTNGCDSVVTTMVQLLPSDTTHLFSTSCDLAKVGVFTKIWSNIYGCDSTEISTVSFSLSDTTLICTGNCDPAATGTFFKNLFTTEGCDSVVITKVTLLPSNTTLLSGASCNPTEEGVFTQHLTNQYGCDSTVLRTITFFHLDTTYVSATTCDSMAVGVFPNTLKTSEGCDSVVITNISLLPSNTTLLSGASCNPAEAGVFTQHLTNKYGCDSTVLTTITFFHLDTTYVSATTCDSMAVGTFPKIFKTSEGCDSVVITNISLLPSNVTQLTDFSCNPAEVGVFTQKLNNIYGCDSTVIRTVQLLPSSTTLLQYTTCDPLQVGSVVTMRTNYLGCDSTITAITSLLPASGCGVTASLTGSTIPCGQTRGFLTLTPTLGEAPFNYTILLNGVAIKNGILNAVNLPVVMDSLPAGNYTVNVSSANGFTVTAQSSIVQWFTPSLSLETITDFNQYAVSCQGAMDGQARAIATGGKAPYLFSWSDGSSGEQVKGLGAGKYQVTVSDANQCTQTANITLTEPTALSFDFSVSNLTCFGTNNGKIYVDAQGGVPPYRYTMDNVHFQQTNVFSGLKPGLYSVTTYDANDCQRTELILVNPAIQVTVDLGNNHIISLGDSDTLRAIVNVPVDSILSVTWTPAFTNPDCVACLEQVVTPFISTTYSVKIVATNGCSDDDKVVVTVNRRKYVYVPNVFTPDQANANNKFSIFAKEGTVKNIRSFQIFDRWGDWVYTQENFQPNHPEIGWDGRGKGQSVVPGVFVWYAEIEFTDGVVEQYKGDVTVLR